MGFILFFVLIISVIISLLCRFYAACPILAICVGIYFLFAWNAEYERLSAPPAIIKAETKMELFKGVRHFVHFKIKNTFQNAEDIADIAVLCGIDNHVLPRIWVSGVGNQINEIKVTPDFISIKMDLSYSDTDIDVREGELVECYIGTDIDTLLNVEVRKH